MSRQTRHRRFSFHCFVVIFVVVVVVIINTVINRIVIILIIITVIIIITFIVVVVIIVVIIMPYCFIEVLLLLFCYYFIVVVTEMKRFNRRGKVKAEASVNFAVSISFKMNRKTWENVYIVSFHGDTVCSMWHFTQTRRQISLLSLFSSASCFSHIWKFSSAFQLCGMAIFKWVLTSHITSLCDRRFLIGQSGEKNNELYAVNWWNLSEIIRVLGNSRRKREYFMINWNNWGDISADIISSAISRSFGKVRELARKDVNGNWLEFW